MSQPAKFQRFQKVDLLLLQPGDRFFKSGDPNKTPHTVVEIGAKNILVKSDKEIHSYELGKNTSVFFLRHKF